MMEGDEIHNNSVSDNRINADAIVKQVIKNGKL